MSILLCGHQFQMRRQDTSHNGVDMQTRATLMELVIYDYSWVDLELGGVYSDEEKKQVSVHLQQILPLRLLHQQ